MIKDYREMLSQELVARVEKNSNYSLRAFARDLEVSPGYLSLLLNRQKTLSPRRAVQLAARLNWQDQFEEEFIRSVMFESSDRELDFDLSSREKFDDLSMDKFELIARWHYPAVLELLALSKDTQAAQQISWLAERLDLTESMVNSALQSLKRLELVEISTNSVDKSQTFWSPTHKHIEVKGVPTRAIRNFHRESLERAADAIEDQDTKIRQNQSIMFAFNSSRIIEVGKKIDKFIEDTNREEMKHNPDSVYQLCVSFVRVDASKPKISQQNADPNVDYNLSVTELPQTKLPKSKIESSAGL